LSRKFTRRKFLEGAGAACIALASTLGCEPAPHTSSARAFRSRPDLSPPTIDIVTQAHDNIAPGYVFVAPKKGPGQDGPMIVDNAGQVVWFRPMRGEGVRAMDFKVQRYRGEPVLTWCESKVVAGHGHGEYVIADGSYRVLRRVRAGNGYHGDHHEFLITARDTALITIYDSTRMDLSPFGGSKDGRVHDGIVQEIDLETEEVIFEWHSLNHVGPDESYLEPPENPEWPFDYFHINSIEVDYDDNLLISARKTFAVYKVDRKSGKVLWRLGGKKSSFEMGPGTRTRYQHDARRQSDGTITIFDNGGLYMIYPSNGIVLELDEDEMSAVPVRRYVHPARRHVATMGNMQVLPSGNVFIGWGSDPLFSEFSRDGELLFHARFPPEGESYRAFRFPWSGMPGDEAPAIAVEAGSSDELKVYASWNGATEVASWQVVAGSSSDRLEPVGSSVPKEGFETAIPVRTAKPYIGVQARDRSGRVLGTSRTIRPGNQAAFADSRAPCSGCEPRLQWTRRS
jgi:Arylsulfotransferase (ASST)